MFHRVKSETQAPKSNTKAYAYEEEATESAEESSEEQDDTFEFESREAEESQEDTEENNEDETSQQKETYRMSDRTENAAKEETRESRFIPSLYGRPAQPALRTGGYPGASYAASPAQQSSAQAERETEASGRTLTIGEGITMSGEIEACDSLVIEGTVEAALKGARILEVASTGTFFGSVEIEEAVIAGRFEGELTVRGRLTLRSGGVITGAIVYGELEIEAGAIIDGRLTPIAAGQQAQKSPAKSKTQATSAKAKVARPGQKSAANNEGGLFAAEA